MTVVQSLMGLHLTLKANFGNVEELVVLVLKSLRIIESGDLMLCGRTGAPKERPGEPLVKVQP